MFACVNVGSILRALITNANHMEISQSVGKEIEFQDSCPSLPITDEQHFPNRSLNRGKIKQMGKNHSDPSDKSCRLQQRDSPTNLMLELEK